jgi:hypothetical protein
MINMDERTRELWDEKSAAYNKLADAITEKGISIALLEDFQLKLSRF